MKKLIFLLLFIAIGWGYYEGTQESHTIKPQNRGAVAETVPAPSSSSSLVDEAGKAAVSITRSIGDGVKTVITGITGITGSAPGEKPAALPAQTAPAAPSLQQGNATLRDVPPSDTLKEQFDDVYDFPKALESRLNRTQFVPADQIPKLLKEAIVAAEDRRFYEHGALDPIGVTRAAINNYLAGTAVEGGSTIAQQTVKNIFLSNERTMTRKIREMFLAVQLERNYTKDQILEIYLNTIYFGHGTYGIGEAAKTYFHKSVKDLTLAECAMLAGLPQAPSAYEPIDHPLEGKKRMTTVLMLMAREGYITPEEASKAAMAALMK